MNSIFTIDPGNIYSAYCIIGENYKPIAFDKLSNVSVAEKLADAINSGINDVVIEMVASYGMAVGAEVFETCVWIGRFMQIAVSLGAKAHRIVRLKVKTNICHSAKANDSNIRKALIDRFAVHDLRNGKGTKKEPDFFYGFHADVWAAYAVGVTYLDGGN